MIAQLQWRFQTDSGWEDVFECFECLLLKPKPINIVTGSMAACNLSRETVTKQKKLCVTVSPVPLYSC